MEQVTTLFPPAFPALALAHFMALLSPGPDFFLLVGYAVRYRLRGSVGLCLGIAAGNGLYILLVVIGSGLLRQTPLLFTIIEPLGAAYLLWGGRQLLKSRAGLLEWRYAASACPSLAKQLLLGLGSSLLNPKNALFYLALMTALLGPNVTVTQQAICGIWMTSVVLLWDLLLITLIALPQIQRRLGKLVWKIERAAGGILIAFGSWIMWQLITS
ncbi:LysE family translocator [Salmonella enterica]|uniref:LysE family translocator n=1 Tax=Salmonella enterica TaxID=28901 RepID=A0A626YHS3_SALER|nr:LysE family translocator [Salmonella enterica]EAA5439713.1 LysE family translocator [Salmonella enterica subsp. diarizonae]EBR3876154.1 LysE family translocator [Salmonella enterica subsp. arizonae]EED8460216.1 LysE family translocator [Salmonella enterica subsp. diarizonae serovar 61:i:z53]EIG1166820.1 LysE family translocator [Salmonella enterica subsp. diarizonae serovar 48:k:z53]EKO0999211.1 LysE family translocator [Salmonella enterica subsp. enterica]